MSRGQRYIWKEHKTQCKEKAAFGLVLPHMHTTFKCRTCCKQGQATSALVSAKEMDPARFDKPPCRALPQESTGQMPDLITCMTGFEALAEWDNTRYEIPIETDERFESKAGKIWETPLGPA